MALLATFLNELKAEQAQKQHNDKNPSMSINTENGLFNCFSCPAQGDMIKFYMHQKHVDFKTACRELNI